MIRAIAGLVAAASFALIDSAPVDAAELSPSAASPPAFRLPAGARPLAYDLTLTVVPGEAKAAGEIAIDVELDGTHPLLWLNADTLTVSRATVATPATRVSIVAGGEQFVRLVFDPALPAGRHRVTLAFEAEQSTNSTRGVDLGRLGAGATPTRIVVPAGRADDTSFAAQAYPQLFTQLERWFGIRYPFDKLDHITIPLTVGFAMEGCRVEIDARPVRAPLPDDGAALVRRSRARAAGSSLPAGPDVRRPRDLDGAAHRARMEPCTPRAARLHRRQLRRVD